MSIPRKTLASAWRREVGMLLMWLTLWVVVGLSFGRLLVFLLAGVVLYLVFQLVQTYRLHAWLLSDNDRQAPDGSGVWEEIYLRFHEVDRRSQKRKKHLKNMVDEFQASTAALPDGAVVLDAQGKIAWFNEAATSLLGLQSPKDVGQRIVNLIRNPDFTRYMASPGDKASVEISALNEEDGTLMLRLIPYGNGQRLLIARDISHQKHIDAMRRDFVANASHELRTPLTVLRGYLEMMNEEAGDGDTLARWKGPVKEMSSQAWRMNRIIEDLLKLARVESEGLHQRQEEVDVPSMLQRLVADMRRNNSKEHVFSADIEEGLFLYGRSNELESVFSNLVLNAAQYTPKGGEISLKWASDENGCRFSVTDTGIGIPLQHIDRLTERFYRVDPARSSASGGTGLGLAIVKHCLEHHEGRLDIASEINAGSTFSCVFPADRLRSRKAA